MADADLRLIVVWTASIATDGAEGAKSATALFDHPHVRQFYDHERLVGQRFAATINMRSLREVAEAKGGSIETLESRFQKSYVEGPAAVFDTIFFFPPGVEWGDAPPAPANWVTQLDPGTFELDGERFRWGEALGDEVGRIARALLRKPHEPSAVTARRIFDAEAPDTTCEDLTRYQDRFVAVLSETGKLRVLGSSDGETWSSLALLEEADVPLEHARLSVLPDSRLVLIADGSESGIPRGRVAYSTDGATWTAFEPLQGVASLMDLEWHDGTGYALALRVAAGTELSSSNGLYRTRDGKTYEPVHEDASWRSPRASLAFEDDGSLVAVMDVAPSSGDALLVRAEPPYAEHRFQSIERELVVSDLAIAGEKWLLATRAFPFDDGSNASAVVALEPDGSLGRPVALPGGESAGATCLLVSDGELWTLYTSAHEGSNAVYLARAPLAGW